MLTMYELKEKLGWDWCRDTADLAADIEGLGYEVIECGLERLSFYDPRESDGLQYTLRLRGISHIAIDSLETDRV